ncbi:hypothetical protein BST81_16690 [Leptolyngbya sp. 'hensonii']|uniref:CRISPR-associated protein Csx18 n=1 Tax=Leptolyngbya sp. 'hensonii' TaxID=1922337 RepID=UPI00094F617C|nr:CRISPR-associated protein Csx18 [Leptolyngbya sp. 'hensonii']OLP17427.1 hypothetical protein BST81_16690 [Leptolyngbya sp. 'hensonii']
MYISSRAAVVRNFSIAAVNGAITLVILLIAPLGLAAVIINTLLVTVATYATATVADRIIRFLAPSAPSPDLMAESQRSQLRQPDPRDLDRR